MKNISCYSYSFNLKGDLVLLGIVAPISLSWVLLFVVVFSLLTFLG